MSQKISILMSPRVVSRVTDILRLRGIPNLWEGGKVGLVLDGFPTDTTRFFVMGVQIPALRGHSSM